MRLEALAVLLATSAALPAHGAPERRRDRSPLEMFLANAKGGARWVPGELLISAIGTDHRPALEIAGARLGCTLQRGFGPRPLYLFDCPARAHDMPGLFAAFEKVEGVRWIEASYLEEEEAAPNDLDPRQWYHQNTGQVFEDWSGAPGADLRSLDAWDIATGDRELVILVVDIGIHPEHQDLRGQLWQNPREICGNGIDDDDNGYVDDCAGWDFGDDDPDPDPRTLPETNSNDGTCLRWHASMIAGLAGARGNDGVGMAGVNWDVRLMNVKKHRDASCLSATSRSIEAIAYGIDNGAHVLAMSFSGSTYNATFEEVLQEAEAKGLIAVSSGGNSGRDSDGLRRYPNDYAIANKLVVANSSNQDRLWPGSNWGATSIDLAAPGAFVLSTHVESPAAYSLGTGSSYSVGLVAGAVTLAWSAFPMLSSAEVVRAIFEGVRPIPELDCARSARCVRSGGRLDLFGMMSRAGELAPAELSFTALELEEDGDGDGRLQPGEQLLVRPRLENQGRGGAFLVALRLEVEDPTRLEATPALELGHLPPGAVREATEALALAPAVGCTASGPEGVLVVAEDRLGRTWRAPLEVPLDCPPPPEPEPEPEPEPMTDPFEEPRPEPRAPEPPDEHVELPAVASGCTHTPVAATSPALLFGLALWALRRRSCSRSCSRRRR